MSRPGPEASGSRTYAGRSLHPGTADADVLVLDEPLSFWGGVDQAGTVVDGHHPQLGSLLAGRVVAMPSGRGSSSSTAVLAELLRRGTGPAAVLLAECDTILVTGALVAHEMYGVALPLVQLDPAALAGLRTGCRAHVEAGAAAEPATVTVEGP